MYAIKALLEKQIELGNYLLDSLEISMDGNKPSLVKKTIKNNGYYYIQTYTGAPIKKKQIYIGKENTDEVKRIKLNKFNEKLASAIKHNINLLTSILPKLKDCNPVSIYENLPKAYQGFTFPYFPSKVSADMKELSEHMETMPQSLHAYACVAEDNTLIRSKGEIIIYNMLKKYNLNFIYEGKLPLKDINGVKTFRYPDFIIILPNNEIIIWEHLGLLENKDYREKFTEKLGIYLQNGYTINENLIITSDNVKGAINVSLIDEIIKTFILPKTKMQSIY